MDKPAVVTEKMIQDEIKRPKGEGAQKPVPPDWRAVPGVEFVEVHRDGRLRLVRALEPVGGIVDVQCGGARVRAAPGTLHQAAWPELWPAPAGPTPIIPLVQATPPPRPPRMFEGLGRARATQEVADVDRGLELALHAAWVQRFRR